MDFFKPEDFISLDNSHYETQGQRVAAAKDANEKLEREGRVVYSNNAHAWLEHNSSISLKKALLINIEPIEKCAHSKEKVVIKCNEKTGISFYECACGVEVIPETFKVKND